jgi:hypothetical protein
VGYNSGNYSISNKKIYLMWQKYAASSFQLG